MFLTNRRSGFDRGGQQVASGLFFIMFSNPDRTKGQRELRGCVRFVSMEQLGHFMMGHVRIGGYSLTLSGSYGSDGLPFDLGRYFVGLVDGEAKFADFTPEQKAAIWEQLTPLPPELAETYWKSDGHNDAGTAGPALRKWAKENMAAMRKTIHRV
jgi:hypothetical protein